MKPHRFPKSSGHPRATGAAIATALLLALVCAKPMRAFDHKGPPAPKPANEYAAYDAHPDEKVTIAAEPCEDQKDCSFFRLPYIQHGLLPVRVVVTNDSDRALSLDDARIQLITGDNQKIPAATDDDINRRMFTFKNARGTRIPVIGIPVHHPIDKKITDDENDFGFRTTTVQPHSTLAGYLFYDIKDLNDPPLAHAELYVKMVHTLDNSHDLFAFSIPLDKWLEANPDAPSNHPRR